MKLSQNLVVEACLSGIKVANKEFEKWTGGWSARYAPESLTQTEIARQLHNKGCPGVYLEDSVEDLIFNSGGDMDGEIIRNKKGRVDISVWNNSLKPRYVIEIKRANSVDRLSKDIERMDKILQRCPTIKRGFQVVLTSAHRENTIHERISKIEDVYESQVRGKTMFNSTNKKNKDVFVAGIVLMIKP